MEEKKTKSLYESYFSECLPDMIRDLQGLINIPGVSSDLPEVKRSLHYTLDLAKAMGFKAESFENNMVGVVEMGGGDETLGILTHVDVVPAGDERHWLYPPYQFTQDGNRLYGRGTQDDKGMVIASLYAMKAVLDAGVQLKKKVQLIIGTQEEVEWTDLTEYVKHYPLPDYGFTPDGGYPMCNAEKGYCDAEMHFSFESCIVDIDCGIANNSVPGEAKAVLSDGTVVTAYGKAVHSSMPEKGENALMNLIAMLDDVVSEDDPLLKILHRVEAQFGDPYGKGTPLYSESEYYNGEKVHRNVLSPTVVQARDGICKVNINLRYAYGSDEDVIVKAFRDFAAENGGEVVHLDLQSPIFVSRERPFLQIFGDVYEEITGEKNEFGIAYGGTYAKAMPNIVSWGPIFPWDEDTCHELNEYITTDSLLKNCVIFAEAIARIVSADEPLK